MLEVFTLLVLFQIKHFICDYPLQTPYMLGKMNKTGWVEPLAFHAFVHSFYTWLLVYLTMSFLLDVKGLTLAYTSFGLAIADFILHFIVDRIKASPNLGGRWKPEQPYFWWALGADQMAHHLINYLFIFIIISL